MLVVREGQNRRHCMSCVKARHCEWASAGFLFKGCGLGLPLFGAAIIGEGQNNPWASAQPASWLHNLVQEISETK